MDIQNVTTPEVNQEAPKSKLGLFALIGVVLVTAIAGGVYYFGFAKEAPPALPSQGGLQGSISNQATGFYEYTAADVTAHKAETGPKGKISSKRGVSYPYITEDTTMGDLLTKDTVPVKETAVMYGYWDNSVSKWNTTQQTVPAWAAVTTSLSGTGLTTGKGVAKAGRALALITNVTSLEAYKLADPSVEPSAALAKAAVDSLAEGWHLVALDKTEFERVKKSFKYSSFWMLNADGNFVEVPTTFDSKDLKNYVFWLKFNFKPAVDAAKVADVTTGTMAWDADGNLIVPWTKVDGATTYKVTVGTGTYVVSADGKVTLGGVAVDDKVATSAKTATGYTLTVKKTTAVDSTKPIVVTVEAFKGTELIATTEAKTVAAKAAEAATPAALETESKWETNGLLVAWREVKDATMYVVTVDESATTYTVTADGKTTADPHAMTSTKAADGTTFTVTLLGLDSTKDHTVKVEAYKDAAVVAATSPAVAKVPAKAADATGDETDTVVDIKGADGFVVEATPEDSAITLSPDFDKVTLSAENKVKVQAAFEGFSIAYDNGTKQVVLLSYDHETKVFTSSDKDILITDNTAKISALTNDTEYTFTVTALYKGYKSTPVTVKATPKAAEADPLTVTTVGSPTGDYTGATGATEYGTFVFNNGLKAKDEITVTAVILKFSQGDCTFIDNTKIFQKIGNDDGVKTATCSTANGISSLEFAEGFTMTQNQAFYVKFDVFDAAKDKKIQLALAKVEYKVGAKSYILDNTAHPLVGPIVSISAPAQISDTLELSFPVAYYKGVMIPIKSDTFAPDATQAFKGLEVSYGDKNELLIATTAKDSVLLKHTFTTSNDVSVKGNRIYIANLDAAKEYIFQVKMAYGDGTQYGDSADTKATTDPLDITYVTDSGATEAKASDTLVEYGSFSFNNLSASGVTVINLLFLLTQGACADIENAIITTDIANDTPALNCSTSDGKDYLATGEEAFPITAEVGAFFTPKSDIVAGAQAGDVIQLALVEVAYEDAADAEKTYSANFKETPLAGSKITITAPLNYGFASLFDDILDSLFNLFR